MNSEETLQILKNRICEYTEKSKAFNCKKTVIICEIHETEEIKDFCLNNNLRIDVFDIFVNEGSVFHQFKLWGNNAHYFISKKVMTDLLFRKIVNSEIAMNNIYVGPTSAGYFDLYDKRDNIINNIDKITELMNLFNDEHSIEVLLNVLVRLSVPYQFHFYYEPEDYVQYFNEKFKFTEYEYFMDAGVGNGINIYEFINKVNWKYNKIIGLEADDNNFNIAAENIINIENVELLNKALYDYDGNIRFLSTERSSKKSNSRVGEDGNIVVETIKGDSLNEPFTFIKMDIEGSEMHALEGLKETIKTYNPKLAICVYHFQSDFWEVPLKIWSLNQNYTLELRNHKKLDDLTETIVYAWV